MKTYWAGGCNLQLFTISKAVISWNYSVNNALHFYFLYSFYSILLLSFCCCLVSFVQWPFHECPYLFVSFFMYQISWVVLDIGKPGFKLLPFRVCVQLTETWWMLVVELISWEAACYFTAFCCFIPIQHSCAHNVSSRTQRTPHYLSKFHYRNNWYLGKGNYLKIIGHMCRWSEVESCGFNLHGLIWGLLP